jgi:hypothetical protein
MGTSLLASKPAAAPDEMPREHMDTHVRLENLSNRLAALLP